MTEQVFDNLLAIDTSSHTLRLALAYGQDRLVQFSEDVEKSHGQILLKKIGDLFGSAGLETKDLQGLIAVVGPGSFTGLRIGLAAIKGLEAVLQIPIAQLNLFEISAHRLASLSEAATVIVPSRKGEVYVSRIAAGQVVPESTSVLPIAKLGQYAEHSRLHLIGSADWLKEMVGGLEPDQLLTFTGADLISLGRKKLEANQVADVISLEPLYLQRPIAEVNFEQRQ